ncbi:uncharacterized protein BDW70DRAFT_142495 [Aspergillus foveolatus]|uniref:uncharacterized protein n=1 Tax=Aspergillus foveolatus TaxID=210207 RepID=UPI003CCD189C
MGSLPQANPRLTTALFLAFGGTIAICLSKRYLEKSCPRVLITQLPKASACRNIVESSEKAPGSPWGTDKSVLLPAWPGSDGIKRETQKTHWMSSLVALQVDVPVAQLERYGISETGDAYDLSRDLFSAFLDARARGLEAWFLDKDVPQRSFTPESLLFGGSHSAGALMLGYWSSARGIQLEQPILPAETASPVCEFRPSKAMITASNICTETDAAGTVLYWKFPRRLVGQIDKAASYGIPWRLMDGGFQEFVVEKILDETAKVTYVTVECGNMYPGGKREMDFKKMPWWLYELHVVYAQILLWKTMKQFGRS